MNFLFKKKLMKMNYFTHILLIFVLIYFFILISTYIFQRNLLYHPTENNYSGDQILVSIEKVKINTQDGIELMSWYHNKNVNNYKTILFLHGNAGSLENRIHKINHFKDMNINFLLVAWRGFSGNKGTPTEKGLYEDAESAVRWLKSKGVRENNIIVYGESLGTGVATEIAQNKKFAGIILDTHSLKNFKQYMIIGLGINVVSSPILSEYPTTYLKEFSKVKSVPEFLSFFYKIFFENLNKIQNSQKNLFIDIYKKSLMFVGEKIHIKLRDNSVVKGIFKGINNDGSLKLQSEHGLTSVYSGRIQI